MKTKEELIAYQYGLTFVPESPEKSAPCYDERMHSLVSETRTERGHKRNIRNMSAWLEGAKERRREEEYKTDTFELVSYQS